MTTTCQICGRAIKTVGGRIAHHGYTRRFGWQTRSCFGARYRPWELACDALPRAIEAAMQFVKNRQDAVAKLRTDPPAELNAARRSRYNPRPASRMVARPADFDPAEPRGHDTYTNAFRAIVDEHERAIRESQQAIVEMGERFDSWVLQEGVTS